MALHWVIWKTVSLQMCEDPESYKRRAWQVGRAAVREAARTLSKDHDVSFSVESTEVFRSGKRESELEGLDIF